MMTNDLVSILMPSYNTADFIEESIQSVQKQSYQNWELIIVDDCSVDNSDQVIKTLAAKDSRIKYYRLEKNSGAAVARNFGLHQSKGRFIAFLDSDDLWVQEKLSTQLSLMIENDWKFTYSKYQKIDEDGKLLTEMGVPEKVNYSQLLKTCVIGCLTVVYDTTYFGKVEMPLIRRSQDFGLWLQLLKKVDYAYGLSKNLGYYRLRKSSTTANKKKAALFTWKLYREVEHLSFVVSVWNFSHYAFRGILRQKFPGLARFLGVLQ